MIDTCIAPGCTNVVRTPSEYCNNHTRIRSTAEIPANTPNPAHFDLTHAAALHASKPLGINTTIGTHPGINSGRVTLPDVVESKQPPGELSGGNVNYYLLKIDDPKRLRPYEAEAEDIIEALEMTFAEGNVFKALWRSCAMRVRGHGKRGADDHGVYDGDKIDYYGGRVKVQRHRKAKTAKVQREATASTFSVPRPPLDPIPHKHTPTQFIRTKEDPFGLGPQPKPQAG